MAVEMAKGKSKDLFSGQSIFRRELTEVEELDIDFLGMIHMQVPEGKTGCRGSDWDLYCSLKTTVLNGAVWTVISSFWGGSGRPSQSLGSQVEWRCWASSSFAAC